MRGESHVYIGPVFVCTPTMVTHHGIRSVCMNEECPRYKNMPGDQDISFCGYCGHPYTNQPYTYGVAQQSQEGVLSECRKLGLIYRSLEIPFGSQNNEHIFIINRYAHTQWRFHLNNGYFTFYEPYTKSVEREIIAYFRDELDLLSRHYQSVQTRWGALEWYEEVYE